MPSDASQDPLAPAPAGVAPWSLRPRLVEGLPVGIVLHRDGVVLYANRETARIAGVDAPASLVGADLLSFLEPEEHEEVLERIQRVQEGRTVSEAPYSITRADGERRHLEVTAIPVLHDGGDAVQLILRDVTARREAREALRRSERKWARLFDLSPMALWLVTAREGRVLEVNDGWVSFFGWDRDAAVGSTEEELGLWPHPAEREEVSRHVRETGAIREMAVRVRTRRGDVREAVFFGERIEIGGRTCLLGLAHDVTEMRRFGRELARMALYDTLTGLPNRNLFRDRLDHALRRADRDGTQLAVLFLDLDRFKRVNDTLGHPSGDFLLGSVADRLKTCFRDQDTVARFGGDEFAGLLEDVAGPEQAEAAAQRLLGAFGEPFDVRGHRVDISASIGIACSGAEAMGADQLLRLADVAMYRAKERPDTVYHLFRDGRDALSAKRLRAEEELRAALDRDEIVVRYQPVVALEDGRVTGAEALVGWRHPERGLLAASDFLPLAEETGLVVPIGDRVLERALAEVAGWSASGAIPDGFRLSLNLSLRQFRRPDLEEEMRACLSRHGTAPGLVRIELAESAVMQGIDRVRALHDLGVEVVVDDFGTGYSSLESLKHLRVDALKVGASFVSRLVEDEADAAIVRAILLVAGGLGLGVIAEGVEEERQRDALLELGCRLGQGSLFSPAVPGDAFRSMLERGSV